MGDAKCHHHPTRCDTASALCVFAAFSPKTMPLPCLLPLPFAAKAVPSPCGLPASGHSPHSGTRMDRLYFDNANAFAAGEPLRNTVDKRGDQFIKPKL